MRPALPTATRATPSQLFDGGDSLADDDTRANWAVPWSDLMMTMFVLFAALLAAQTLHARAEQKKHAREIEVLKQVEPRIVEREKIVYRDVPVPVQVEPPRTIDPLTEVDVLERSREAVREAGLAGAEVAVMPDRSVKLSVQGPAFFAPGRAELRPEVARFLERIAAVIRATPWDVRIVGHTDDRAIHGGPYPSNWELSLARASRVARYLIERGGIDPARFYVMGRGEYDPAHANRDPASRALNRRVEIIITREAGPGARP